MSINYVALASRDPDTVGPALEGGDPRPPSIDSAAARAALHRLRYFEGGETGTLKWEGEGSYVFADVLTDHVLITHGTGGGETQMDVIMEAIYELQQLGLHVWDPQQGDWFPG